MENNIEIKNRRPLSPHLTIYKPQISSVLSIGHRLSGIGLFTMLLFLTWNFILWVFCDFNQLHLDLLKHPIVKCLLFITSYGYFYHFSTGIRHLIWDIGCGFSIKAVDIGGYLAIISSVLLTMLFWYMIL